MIQNEIVLVISTTIVQDGKVLMIKENKATVKNKWNFPSGRVEKGEDILEAACREVKEETGLDVKLTHTTGIYNFISSTDHQVILFHFIAQITGGFLSLQEEEIADSKWVNLSNLNRFRDGELRNAKVIRQILDAVKADRLYPLELFIKLS
ncbi:DNA mismatch repair protein MutT [Cytobacillus firmus]|uniref:NUDIX hydrolase n=1 Tax=Cytobacillus firmus TaxID=1399 RepID=UPI00077C4B16|nr:NUDIX domain-containing protein [Cytobacillus firmus]MBG9544333.1 DNA mismatch repair protein MutT [Cytobacillus firmus]MBG9553290.1 DNA mismatch repair protein MutT [Cytobacillus firmus]MBG9558059.1 DNA mismatch repair protein MutT [Cytobacillus firmus]MBG9575087.1 DNA mismatch repair protein MutT [Cytobacillus firmus]MEC1894430.1 NUDIX domain-containing protein [Cytobacillus firmus]